MKNKLLYISIGLIAMFLLMRSCDGEVKTVTETKTITKIVRDTINKVKIEKVPEVVYVNRLKTITGKDSIVYRNKPDTTTIKANRYKTELISGKAKSNLEITTTGELLDVTGVIEYPETETITTITKTIEASGLYLYGSVPVNNFSSPELGLMFQFKNKVGIIAGAQYNSLTKHPDLKLGLLIKL